ncbi:MAG: hypoxanthine phosphoribosyltransferase [Chloroflexota bacterium]
MQDYKEFIDEIIIPTDKLQARIAALGAEISADYQSKDLLLVCILRGGVFFLTDLMRQIDVPHTVDFMAVASYGIGARRTSGQARLSLDLNTDIRGRNVLLVEDIVDSGYTIESVLELLSTRHPKSLRVCVLLDKVERREVPVPIHYRGFTIPDKFIFGYGLDVDEYYRHLPFIATVNLDRLQATAHTQSST